jgi:AbiV family abortive infection protein
MKPMDNMSKEEKKAIFARKMKLLDLYEACMDNAGKFIDEAKILFEHQAFSRAAFLAYCGLEETGKAQIVADYYNGDLSEEEFTKYYRDHTGKAAYTGREVELSGTPIREELMRAVVDQDDGAEDTVVEQVWRIDSFSMRVDPKKGKGYRACREPALYVGFDAEFNPILPDEQVNQQAAETMIARAFNTWRRILEMDAVTEGIGARGHFK